MPRKAKVKKLALHRMPYSKNPFKDYNTEAPNQMMATINAFVKYLQISDSNGDIEALLWDLCLELKAMGIKVDKILGNPVLSESFTEFLYEDRLKHITKEFKHYIYSCIESMIYELQEFWEKTNNPYFVWEAIRIITPRQNKIPFPGWVLKYLSQSANLLVNNHNSIIETPKLLGFGGRGQGSKWLQFHKNCARVRLVEEISNMVENGDDLEHKAYPEAASLWETWTGQSVDIATIANWYQAHKS